MNFAPTPEQLLPELTLRQEFVLLARALWREGYADHLAGHITVNMGDGTLLCNPWFITWDELRPSQLIRIDLDGKVVEGDWPAPLGIPLHLELHKLREDVGVASTAVVSTPLRLLAMLWLQWVKQTLLCLAATECSCWVRQFEPFTKGRLRWNSAANGHGISVQQADVGNR